MALNPTLLRESFDLVVDANPCFVAKFYDKLFEKYPQARPLFAADRRQRQEQMLTEALVAVMAHLEDASWLSGTLGALGTKHAGYGVTPEMYGWVGETLLETLAEVAGPAWNAELYLAWSEAYQAISQLMLQDVAPSR